MGSVKCKVWSVKCRVRSVEYKIKITKYKIWKYLEWGNIAILDYNACTIFYIYYIISMLLLLDVILIMG
jgi:hypothetical protein